MSNDVMSYWATKAICACILIAPFCMLFEIASCVVRIRESRNRLRDREHAREVELFDKQIELELAKHGIVKPNQPEQTGEGTEGAGNNQGVTSQPQQEQQQ